MSSQSFSTGGTSLGAPAERYEGGGNIGNILGALFMMALGAFFVYGFFETASSRSISRSSGNTNVVLGLFGAGFILFGIYLIFQWWRNRGISIQTYSDGLARMQGAKVQEIRWDDVRQVWQSITKHYRNGIYTGTTYLYTVQTANNTRMTFGNEIKNVEKLGQLIQNEATKRLFPQMIAAYNNGQAVVFGDFTISKEGVSHKNKSLPWAEIEGAQINNGFMTFKKQGKWFNWANVPVAKIPNLIVFLSLIDHVVGLKTSGRR